MRRIIRPPILRYACLLALLAFGTWVWFAPHLTVNAMRRAAERGDAEALSSHVDFPALRESVRAQLAARVAGRFGADSRLGRIGAGLVSTFGAPAIDAMVSPEALAVLFAGRDLREEFDAPPQGAASPPETHGAIDTRHWKLSSGYDDLSTFAVVVDTGRDAPAPTRLVFKRHNLLWWKLSGIELAAR